MKTLLMSLIRAAIEQRPADVKAENLTDDVIKNLYHLSKHHDMVHLAGQTLLPFAKQFPENEYFPKFKKQFMIAVLRYEKINYVYHEVCALFEEEKIPFIPLKGSVLRDYYPEPWMRTSCDIDILINEENVERAEAVITEILHYRCEGASRHDVSFFAPNGIHLELHFSLMENDVISNMDKPLSRVWSVAAPILGKTYHHALTPEMFYYYHIAHMAKHFVQGGCGIRPFLDISIYRKKQELDHEVLSALLHEGKLVTFAKQAEYLADVWFGDNEHTELTRSMEAFLLDGGTYGNLENYVAMQQNKKGGKFRYLFSRIFLPFDHLAIAYPILKKHKWLFPLYQVRRWFRLIFCGSLKRSLREIKLNQTASANDLTNAETLLSQLEL